LLKKTGEVSGGSTITRWRKSKEKAGGLKESVKKDIPRSRREMLMPGRNREKGGGREARKYARHWKRL